MRCRQRAVEIEARQFDGTVESANRILGWIGSNGGDAKRAHATRPELGLVIHTLEGDMRAEPGDWIIRGVVGEFYPCRDDIFRATYEEPVKLYGMWRVHEEPAKTGWVSTGGGHVIVAEDPLELTRLDGTEIREFPGTFPHSEWAQGELPPALEIVPAVRTGPEHYREGVRLLTNAAARDAECDRLYGAAHPTDFVTGLLAARAKAHFAAAQVAATAAAVHPGSVSWQEAIGT